MKRKSERRRGEARKKRCAARSGSQAAPQRDIYIAITGKWVLRNEPCQPETRSANTRRRTPRAVRATCTLRAAFYATSLCGNVWLFLQLFDLIWRHRQPLLSPLHEILLSLGGAAFSHIGFLFYSIQSVHTLTSPCMRHRAFMTFISLIRGPKRRCQPRPVLSFPYFYGLFP